MPHLKREDREMKVKVKALEKVSLADAGYAVIRPNNSSKSHVCGYIVDNKHGKIFFRKNNKAEAERVAGVAGWKLEELQLFNKGKGK
jgi:hypothetical protein